MRIPSPRLIGPSVQVMAAVHPPGTPDVLTHGLEADVAGPVGLPRYAQHAAYTALAVARSDTGSNTVLTPLRQGVGSLR
jgi:hypothetical protein